MTDTKKQTAVDLFHDLMVKQLAGKKSITTNTIAQAWLECKVMERQQKKQDIQNYLDWHKAKGYVSHKPIDIEEYYQSTYGKEAQP